MESLLYASLGFLTVMFAVLIYFLYGSRNRVVAEPADEDVRGGVAARQAAVPLIRGGRRRAGGAGPRQRLGQRAAADVDEEVDNDDGEVDASGALAEEKVGVKKQRKLEEKAAKKAQREAELLEREERKKQDERSEQLKKKEEEKQEAMEAAREAEEKRLKEEQEKREHEEYLKLKAEFSVEEEGTDAINDEDMQSLLQEFISYIKEMKVVMLEDLAAHFKIRTQDAIDRIKTLQEDGMLSGVIDDRGKFVYITLEEYEEVARFIKQRGRVSISDLAESMNRLINLNPDNSSVANHLPSPLNREPSLEASSVVC